MKDTPRDEDDDGEMLGDTTLIEEKSTSSLRSSRRMASPSLLLSLPTATYPPLSPSQAKSSGR
jgi:hypothetical protein